MAKIRYNYYVYNGCPEATNISQSRAHMETLLNTFILMILLFGFIGAVIDFRKSWWMLLLLVAVFFIYFKIFLPWRSRQTEKLIKDAIDRRNTRWADAIANHDTGTLVELKIHDVEINNNTFHKLLDLHNIWLENPNKGKQLSLFAEDLSTIDLRGKCITGIILSHCQFCKMNLINTRFINCDLSYCAFIKDDLKYTHFINCDLSYSTYEKCKTKETDFTGSRMIGTKIN